MSHAGQVAEGVLARSFRQGRAVTLSLAGPLSRVVVV